MRRMVRGNECFGVKLSPAIGHPALTFQGLPLLAGNASWVRLLYEET